MAVLEKKSFYILQKNLKTMSEKLTVNFYCSKKSK